MRVICIDEPKADEPRFENLPAPKEGDVDVVIGEYYCIIRKVNFYKLERFGPDLCFSTKHFIPCSEIDETELVNHKEEVHEG